MAQPLPISINSIHQLDCVEAMSQLSEGSVDLAFADPPFNIGYDYDVYDDGRDADTYLGWCKQWLAGVHRALKPDGTFWLAIGDEYAAELKVMAQREVGFHCRSWVIWYYTFGVNCKNKFSRSHVHLFHFVKDPEQFTFNGHAIRVPSARQLVYGDNRANPQGRLPDDTWILRPQDMSEGFQPDEDAWYFPRVAGTFKERAGFHGCQMPEQLLGRIIRACSNPGDLVLDPFAGSSTTLVVAKKLRRNFLGFDISPEYITRGTERLAQVTPGDELEGAAEPRVSAPPTGEGRTRNTTFVQNIPQHTAVDATSKPTFKIDANLQQLLLDAFSRTWQKYSVDRVIADPQLNSDFILACQGLGADLPPAQLNHSLFRLRKAGKLSHLRAERRTEYTAQEYDQYLFAAEMAWKRIVDSHPEISLDEILCDPQQAAQFDQLAAQFAPGFEPLQYRWAALTLRKLAKNARTRAVDLSAVKRVRKAPIALDELDRWNGESCLYLIEGDRKPLYVGETLDLAARIRSQIGESQVQPSWKQYADEVQVKCIPVSTIDRLTRDALRARRLVAYQTHLIEEYRPSLNLSLLAAT